MPTVNPVNQNTERLQPLTQARLQAADFGSAGEQIGRAAQGLGRDIAQAAEVQQEINDRLDTAAVKTKLAEASAALAPIRSSVLSSQGLNTVAAKTAALPQIEKVRTDFVSGMANKRQQKMFADAFAPMAFAEHSTYDEYEGKQVRAAEIAGAKARGVASFDRAIDLRSNPEASKAALDDSILEDRNANPGLPAEVYARMAAEKVSSYRIGIADTLRDENPLEAEHYINEHAGEILPDDETKFRRSIKGEVEEAETDVGLGMVFAEAQNPSTPEKIAETVDTRSARYSPVGGKGTVSSGFTSTRDGGKRQHAADDYPAPAGTPVRPPMGGTVEKVWFDPKGGNSVLIRHPDGRVTGYAHLRNVNVEAGENVTADTVVGGVGNTGSGSHGNHLHFTVRNADGNRVDPAAQKWSVKDLPAYSTERVDSQRLYDSARRVAEREGWTKRQYDRVIAGIDQQASRNDNLRVRAEQDAVDAVGEILDKMPVDGFTDVSQIPKNVRDKLPPGKLASYRELAKRNLTGSDVEDDSGAYLDLYELSGNAATQDQFSRMDLTSLASKMSKADFRRLRKSQIDIRNGGGAKSDTAVTFSRVDSMIERYAPQSGGLSFEGAKGKEKDAVRVRRAQVGDVVRRQVAALQEKQGRQATDDEVAAIVRSQLAPVYTSNDGSRGGMMARGAVAPGQRVAVEVPKADRTQIFQALTRKYPGRQITEGMIARVYLEAGGGLK